MDDEKFTPENNTDSGYADDGREISILDTADDLTDTEYEDILGKEHTDDDGVSDVIDPSAAGDPNKTLPPDADYEYVNVRGKWKKRKKKKPAAKKKQPAASKANEEEFEKLRKAQEERFRKEEQENRERAIREERQAAERSRAGETYEGRNIAGPEAQDQNIIDQRASNFEADTRPSFVNSEPAADRSEQFSSDGFSERPADKWAESEKPDVRKSVSETACRSETPDGGYREAETGREAYSYSDTYRQSEYTEREEYPERNEEYSERENSTPETSCQPEMQNTEYREAETGHNTSSYSDGYRQNEENAHSEYSERAEKNIFSAIPNQKYTDMYSEKTEETTPQSEATWENRAPREEASRTPEGREPSEWQTPQSEAWHSEVSESDTFHKQEENTQRSSSVVDQRASNFEAEEAHSWKDNHYDTSVNQKDDASDTSYNHADEFKTREESWKPDVKGNDGTPYQPVDDDTPWKPTAEQTDTPWKPEFKSYGVPDSHSDDLPTSGSFGEKPGTHKSVVTVSVSEDGKSAALHINDAVIPVAVMDSGKLVIDNAAFDTVDAKTAESPVFQDAREALQSSVSIDELSTRIDTLNSDYRSGRKTEKVGNTYPEEEQRTTAQTKENSTAPRQENKAPREDYPTTPQNENAPRPNEQKPEDTQSENTPHPDNNRKEDKNSNTPHSDNGENANNGGGSNPNKQNGSNNRNEPKPNTKTENPFKSAKAFSNAGAAGSDHDYEAFRALQGMAQKIIREDKEATKQYAEAAKNGDWLGREPDDRFTKSQRRYINSDKFYNNKKNGMSFRILRTIADSEANSDELLQALNIRNPLKRLTALQTLSAKYANGAIKLDKNDEYILRGALETTRIANAKAQKGKAGSRFASLGAAVMGKVKQNFNDEEHPDEFATDRQNFKSLGVISGELLGVHMGRLGVSGAMGAAGYYLSQQAKFSDAAQTVSKLMLKNPEIDKLMKDAFSSNLALSKEAKNELLFLGLPVKEVKKAIRLYQSAAPMVNTRDLILVHLDPATPGEDLFGIYKRTEDGKFLMNDGKKVMTKNGKKLNDYVNNPQNFFDIRSPKQTIFAVKKLLGNSKNELVKQAVATMDLAKITELLRDPQKYGLTEAEKNLLETLKQALIKNRMMKVMLTKSIRIGKSLSLYILGNSEEAAATLGYINKATLAASATAMLAVAGGKVVGATASFVWNTKLGRFVRKQNARAAHALASTKAGKAIAASAKAAKGAGKKMTGAVATLQSHIAKKASHVVSRASNTAIGKTAAKTMRGARAVGKTVNRGVTKVGGLFGTVTGFIAKPFQAINDSIEATTKWVNNLKKKALIAVIVFILIVLGLLFGGALLINAVSTDSAANIITHERTQTSEPETQTIISHIQSLDKARVTELRKIGTGMPINSTVAANHTLKKYGYAKAQNGNNINNKANKGYNIFYVTKDGQAISNNATNDKSVIAVALTMFNNDVDDAKMSALMDLVDDLYKVMAPSGNLQEYKGTISDTAFNTTSSIYNGDGSSLNIDGSGVFYKESGIKTNDFRPDAANTYSDGYADTYTIYCDEPSTYTVPKQILASGGALYEVNGNSYTKITSASQLPAHTSNGCSTRFDQSAYDSAMAAWKSSEPDTTAYDYANAHASWSQSQPDKSNYTETYCPGHTYAVDYGHKVINIYAPLLMVSDVKKMDLNELLPSDWESKSYADDIQLFVKTGGFKAEEYREMAENIEAQNYSDMYESIDEFSNDATVFVGTSTIETDEDLENALADYEKEYGEVSGTKKALVAFAQTLVGKIPYYYGGGTFLTSKNYADNNFGAAAPTSNPYYSYNYSKTITYQCKYYTHRTMIGLDCSSFINFCLWNVTGKKNLITTTADCPGTEFYDASKLRVGDLGMMNSRSSASQGGGNHIGIYAGKDKNGRNVWIHCAGSTGVVENNFSGFHVYYRLNFLD